MNELDVIIKPLVTEKSTHQQAVRNVYTFQVAPAANKNQIKDAVEKLYKVHVVAVHTMHRKGKPRRSRFKIAHTGAWKRAVVKLAEESRIDIY